ncbi:Ppx/GppA phosphatase family protein [Frateuria aurantia]
MSQTEPTHLDDGELIAAVDMGSNSFHMVVARIEQGEPRVIDRLRDSVRLAAGLRPDGSLDSTHRARAMQCLARFGQRIAGLPSDRVRVVATNTVRRLASPHHFLSAAEAALGHPVEIVSGIEEGRLIFLGAAHDLPATTSPRLIIDIGGGSTEFIIGQGLLPRFTESVQVGCIASSLRFFPQGKITRKRWQKAHSEIALMLQQFAQDYRQSGWQEAYGSSGTAKAIASVAKAMKLPGPGITAAALAGIRDAIITQGQSASLKLPGLSEDRAAVFPGGVAIMEAAFAALGIQSMQLTDSSMREGLLWDLIGRVSGKDPRAASIDALALRYSADAQQAQRVEAAALTLFDQVARQWQLPEVAREWLSWAARVHEIGLAIAHSQHHHHSGYILRHTDLAGFSRQEQQLLAAVVENHRRKPDKNLYLALPLPHRQAARRITALLRLAVLLRRSRRAEPLPPLHLRASARRLLLQLPAQWLAEHPLTAEDLSQEQTLIGPLGLKLVLNAR